LILKVVLKAACDSENCCESYGIYCTLEKITAAKESRNRNSDVALKQSLQFVGFSKKQEETSKLIFSFTRHSLQI
jgi:hypothetical protein